MLITIPAVYSLTMIHEGASPRTAMLILGAIGAMILGPYSFLAGAIALDYGGKKGSATVAGWVDGVGYLGGILAGQPLAKIVEKSGWPYALQTLTGVAAGAFLISLIFVFSSHRQSQRLKLAS